MVAALDAEPRLGAIGCRIVTYADGTDDLSSWGYPADLLPCAGESFDAVTYVGAGHAIRREAWQQAGGYDSEAVLLLGGVRFLPARHRPGLADPLPRRHRHPPQGLRLSSGSAGPPPDGSISYETEFISSASWIMAGSRWCPALPAIC